MFSNSFVSERFSTLSYTIEKMQQFIKKRLDEITKVNLYDIGLSEEELKRRKNKKYFGLALCLTQWNKWIRINKPNPPWQIREEIVAETSYRTNKYSYICIYLHTEPRDQVCKCNKQQGGQHCVEYRLSYIFFILYGVQQDYQLAYYCD